MMEYIETNNIKLIISDLDGTLLKNHAQELDKGTTKLIDSLIKRGVKFCAASGRQYPNLRNLFGEIADKIGYICENGALCMADNKLLAKSSMNREITLQLINDILEVSKAEVLVSGEKKGYLKPKSDRYYTLMRDKIKYKCEIVDDFSEIEDDFIKISIFIWEGIEKDIEQRLKDKYSKYFQVALSGIDWMDFTNLGTNKGNALEKVMEYYNVNSSQIVAFGDNDNDIEMLEKVKYSFAMDTAKENVISSAKYKSSRVEDTIKDLFKIC